MSLCIAVASQGASAAPPASQPQGTLETLPPSSVITLQAPKAVAGIHDLRIVLYQRGKAIHHGYAQVPARDSMVHLVTCMPAGREVLKITDTGIAGCLQVFLFSPAGNYATSCPHHVSGNDQLVTLDIKATIRDGVIQGDWTGTTDWWTSRVGRPTSAQGKLTGRVAATFAPGLPGDALLEGSSWPSVLGPNANASANDYSGRLVDSLSEARLVWVSEDKTTGGRTTKFGYLPNRTLAFYPLPGPYSTPVVGQGLVFHYDSLPVLDDSAKAAVGEGPSPDELKQRGLNPLFFATRNDHAVTAIDAATGRTAWRVRFPGKGADGGGKGGGAGGCSLVGDVLVCVGINGFANGFEARTGKVLWVSQVNLFNGSTSPMPIGGAVVCSLHGGGLAALDPRNGKMLWKIDRASSGHASPVPWRHDGRDHAISLYSGNTQSPARLLCVDPAAGRVAWEHADVGANDVTLSISGDILITNGRKVPSTDVAKMAGGGGRDLPNVTAFRLTATGPQKLWELPPEHLPNTYGYSQPCVAGNLLIPPMHSTPIAVDIASGKIMHSGLAVNGGLTKSGHGGGGIASTTSNGRVFTTGFAVRDAAAGTVLDVWRGPFAVGYIIPILSPIVDGRIFIRSHDAILCYDLREPAGLSKETLELGLPASLFGNPAAASAQLRVRNGRLVHGWLREGESLRAVETSRARWDGKQLTGTLGIDSGWMLEDFDVKAERSGDRMTGTIGAAVRGFAKPLALAGAVQVTARAVAGKEPWTHMLSLQDAARHSDGKAVPLNVGITVADGRITGIVGGPATTGRALLQIDLRKSSIQNDKLSATFTVVFRPDMWISALTEAGPDQRAASMYVVDVDLAKAQDAGSYTGTWGAAWSEELPLTGAVRQTR
jgi:hypothetical protein